MRTLPLLSLLLVLLLTVSAFGVLSSEHGPTVFSSASGAPTLAAPVALGAPPRIGNYVLGSPVPPSTSVTGSITVAQGKSTRALVEYLHAEGLSIRAPPRATVWLVSGPAGDLERAFSTSLSYYSDPLGRTVMAFTEVPRAPASLPVVALAPPDGLNPMSTDLGAHGAAPTTGSSSLPCPSTTNGILSPAAVQSAYNITPVLSRGIRGQGETIGIVDVYDSAEPPSVISSDLTQFSECFSLPSAGISYDYPVPGGNLNNTSSSGWGLETALDTQWAHATAPDAKIDLALSPNNAYGLYFSVDWLVAMDQVDAISLSWGEPESGIYNLGPCSYQCNASSDGSLATLGPVLAEAAAEGISVFVASGDCGANGGTPTFTPWYPSSDPHAIGVGGTVLRVSANGGYGTETAWNGTQTYCSNGGGSGGGFSSLPRPWWQEGRPGFSAYRNTTRGVPDVALTAGVPLGMIYNGSPVYVEGTSDAAPQWAGLSTLIGAASGGGPPGFLTPVFYDILSSPAYRQDFHQILVGNNGYSAGPYWNAVTGMGTPNFSNLLASVINHTAERIAGPGQMQLTAYPLSGNSPYPWSPLPVNFSLAPWPGQNLSERFQYYLGDVGPPYQEANATTSNASSITSLYRTPGAHVAFAVGYAAGGNVTMSNPLVINVNNSGPLSVTLATATPKGPAGIPIQFVANASGGKGPYRYAYFFGDGTYESSWGSDGPIIDHAYAGNGSYLVTVVANDSSSPQRGGWATECVTIGNTTERCPTLSAPLSVAMMLSNATLLSGGSAAVSLTVTQNGHAVAGASLRFGSSGGSFSQPSVVTNASGQAAVVFFAPSTNQTLQFPLFANASAGGNVTGTGESLVIVNPLTGPTLRPILSLVQPSAVSGASDGLIVSTAVAVTGKVVPNATVALATTVGSLAETTHLVNPDGFLVAELVAPVTATTLGGLISATVSYPGYTSSGTSLSFSVIPGFAGYVVKTRTNVTTLPSMTSTKVALLLTNRTAPPSNISFGGLEATTTAGSFTYWSNLTGGRTTLYYTAPMIRENLTELLFFNVSAATSKTFLGSGVALVNVTWGNGPLALSLYPGNVRPLYHGNLTVRVRSVVNGEPLSGVLLVVKLNSTSGHITPEVGWTGTFGRLNLQLVAPNFTGTVNVSITAIGFVYEYTVKSLPLVLSIPPSKPSLPWTAWGTQANALVLLAGALGGATLVVLLAARREDPKLPSHPPAPPSVG